MSAEYPGATWAAIPGFGFPMGSHGGNTPKFIILHGTASGDGTAQQQVSFFQGDNQHGVHFVIGKDGTVFQMVQLADAAYGNCCVDPAPAHDAFWDTILRRFPNLNCCTISIEHCKIAADNSDVLTPAQQAASFALVAWLCKQLNIPARPADVTGGITGHYSMNGINRANCPGVYPWQQLFQYLANGGHMVPDGWSLNQTTGVLTDRNGNSLDAGFSTLLLEQPYWYGENGLVSAPYADPANGYALRADFWYGNSFGRNAGGTNLFIPVSKEIAALKQQSAPDPKAAAAKAALQAWLAE